MTSKKRAALRRGAIATCVGLAALGTATAPALADGVSRSFANPDNSVRPLYRFWSPVGNLDRASTDKQAREMAESGAGGFETDTFVPVGTPGYDPATMSWGTPAWTQGAENLFASGKAQGLRVDQMYSPKWSGGTPTVSPDGPGSAKEITIARAWVDQGTTFNAALPVNALPRDVNDRTLVAALAYRCLSVCAGNRGEIPVLDQSSVVNLTAQVQSDGTLDWTAPAQTADTRYALVAIWTNGTGQLVDGGGTPTTTWLVDHFSLDGINAIEDVWNSSIFTTELRDDMAASGGSIFFDSLELARNGQQTLHWTPAFLREFQARRGYSLVPYLAAVGVNRPVFDFPDDLGRRIREDYNQTLSDLFRDDHLLPLQEWAHGLGMTVRGQAYSSFGPSPLDAIEMYSLQDIPEGEDRSFTSPGRLNFIETRDSDAWRAMSSAAAMSDHDIVSTECCAVGNQYSYPRQTLAAHVNQQFSVGVTQMVWHGWSDNSPSIATAWPGFEPFSVGGIADDYGPHNPSWTDDRKLNDYVGRTQAVLRSGTLKRDVAIYHQGLGHSNSGASADLYFNDRSLEQAGYQYGFMNKTMVAKARARVSGGRLDADGEAFKAFVFDNTTNVNTQTGALDLNSAKKMLRWSKDGLPVVLVGELPQRVFGVHPGQDAQLQATLAELIVQPNVKQVATEADVLAAIRSLGVTPAASYSAPTPLIGVRRETDDTNYYFFFNSSRDGPISTDVSLTGAGVPYLYDAWTGKITPIAQYERTDTGVKVHVSLESGDAQLIALTTATDLPTTGTDLHVDSSTADTTVYGGDGSIAIRAANPGTYTTTLSNGHVDTTAIDAIPAALTPSQWTLDVTSWEPGIGLTDVAKRALPQTTITADSATGALPGWINVPAVGKLSGVGVYRTTVDLGQGWSGGFGATLDLGRVIGSFTLQVNGQQVAQPDQLDTHTIDLGPYLRAGVNTIAVRVASSLGNAAAPTRLNDVYGLLGPVSLKPYGQAAVTLAGPIQPGVPDVPTLPTPPPTPPTPPTPPARPAPDTTKPRLTKLSVSAKRLRVGKPLSIRFALSEQATVRVALERKLGGRKRGGKCITGAKAPKKGAACVVWKTVRSSKASLKKGTRSITLLTKRQSGRLASGTYRVSLRATDAVGNDSASVRVTVQVRK